MVSVSGVRGRVAEGLTPEVVARYAAGFGAWAIAQGTSRSVVVGRDSRVSGPMFHRATLAALQSVGRERDRRRHRAHADDPARGGIPSRGRRARDHGEPQSHRVERAEIHRAIGLFLDAVDGTEMRKLADGVAPRATWDQLGTVTVDPDAVERHIGAVLALKLIDVPAIRLRKFKVALDCVRGAGGVILPQLLQRLGCTVTAINLETDGRFPRAPEPVAANLGDLEKLVLKAKADVGFATDPDVDRLAIVSDEGKAIGEDWTLALAARLVLRSREGPLVVNLSTSRIMDDVAAEAGYKALRAPVGEVNVAVRMREERGGDRRGGERRRHSERAAPRPRRPGRRGPHLANDGRG